MKTRKYIQLHLLAPLKDGYVRYLLGGKVVLSMPYQGFFDHLGYLRS